MPNEPLVLLSDEDSAKYAGQFVCVEDFGSGKVISADLEPENALGDARNAGAKTPVLFYVPPPGRIFI